MAFKIYNFSIGYDSSADSAVLPAGQLTVNSGNQLQLHDGVTPGGNTIVTSTTVNSLTNGSYTVELDSTGVLNLSSNSIIQGYNSDSNVYIETIGNVYTSIWTFDSSGEIVFPDASIQTTAWLGNVFTLRNSGYSVELTSSGDLIIPGNGFIQGSGVAQVGYQFSIATLANGDTSANTNALDLTETSNTDLISSGWTIRDANNSTTTVSGTSNSGGHTTVFTGSTAFNCQFPLVFTSTDYSPAIYANVAVQSNGNTWIFGTLGTITFPDTTIQTTAWTGNSPLAMTNELFTTNSALSTTTQCHFLAGTSSSPKSYTLGNGVTGQIMYFLPVAGSTDDGTSSVAIVLNSTKNNGGNYQYMGSSTWYPFSSNVAIYNEIHASGIPSSYAIFDGQGWIISGGTIG